MGAGLTTQSKSSGFGYYGREQGGYTVLDARLGYRVDERLSFALNLGNLTDKKYYSPSATTTITTARRAITC